MAEVKFESQRDYEEQLTRCFDSGLDEAGDLIWERVEGFMARHWAREDAVREGGDDARALRMNLRAQARLNGYRDALAAVGVELEAQVSDDGCLCGRIGKVTASRRGFCIGTIAMDAR